MISCKYCGNEKVVKNGLVKNKQRYLCREYRQRYSKQMSYLPIIKKSNTAYVWLVVEGNLNKIIDITLSKKEINQYTQRWHLDKIKILWIDMKDMFHTSLPKSIVLVKMKHLWQSRRILLKGITQPALIDEQKGIVKHLT